MSDVDWNEENRKIVEEFRANAGKVGGHFAQMPIAVVHHRGAKTGTELVNPLAYQRLDDDTVAVFASKGGAPVNPDWYYNLKANPDTTVEVGTEVYPVHARIAEGDERDRIWTK